MTNNLRIETLKQYLADDPTDDFSQYALALEFEKLGNIADAISNLEQILKRNPNYLASYYQLGKFYESEKDSSKATSAYERGMEIALKQNNQKTLNELRSALELLD